MPACSSCTSTGCDCTQGGHGYYHPLEADVGTTDPEDLGESAASGIPESTSFLDPDYDSVYFCAPDPEEA
eukprot:4819714-Pyramimonas_sp.AAC.1